MEGITALFGLQQKYSNADLTVRLLLTQLSTLTSDILDFSFNFDEEVFGSEIDLVALKLSMKRVVRDAHLKPWAIRKHGQDNQWGSDIASREGDHH